MIDFDRHMILRDSVDVIDMILDYIMKKDVWTTLVDKLSALLAEAWTETQRAAIDRAVEVLSSQPVTADSLNEAFDVLGANLSADLVGAMDGAIDGAQRKAYRLAGVELGIEYEFNRADKKAIEWLKKDALYWVGDYYDRMLRDALEAKAGEVVNGSMNRIEAAANFKGLLSERFARVDAYWEGLSNHIVTRSREFGRVSAYEAAGVTHYKIVAYIDRRTSKICKYLNGQIVSVKRAADQRSAMMQASNPEEVKTIAPWYNDVQTDDLEASGKTGDALPDGIGLPPYHFHCRTRTVVASDEEISQQ